MKCAVIEYPDGSQRRIAHGLTEQDGRYTIRELFEMAPSGHEVFASYSSDNFVNSFHDADIQRFREIGWHAEVFRDVVRKRQAQPYEEPPGEGYTPVAYISDFGHPRQMTSHLWMPPKGIYVPVQADNGYRFFYPNTVMPVKVLPTQQRGEAEAIFRDFNLPSEEVSAFQGFQDDCPEAYVLRAIDDQERFIIFMDSRGCNDRGFSERKISARRYFEDAMQVQIS
ncbi:MAG: hypothetical protein AABX14_04620 [Candidatus Aenigmatarchaeota archaeon]